MDLRAFLTEFSYSAEDCAALLSAYEAILACPASRAEFDLLTDAYRAERSYENTAVMEAASSLSKTAGVEPHTGTLLLLMSFGEVLRGFYREAGIPDGIWHDSMLDLKWKNEESKCLYGHCGTFVGSWFLRFFQMTRFALGRLQFEPVELPRDLEIGGVPLKKGRPVLNIHIPRTGTRLDREAVRDAYARAKDFFRGQVPEPFVFVCSSWLLYPKNRELLRPGSNLLGFLDDFEIVSSGQFSDYSETWRLFDCLYPGDPALLPTDTSLRRGYVEWIRSGIPTGWGYGVRIEQ